MAAPIEDVTNPGSENVADQAFDGLPEQVPSFEQIPAQVSPNNRDGGINHDGLTSVDQAVTVSSPASAAVTNDRGDDGDERAPISVDQPVTVSTPGPAVGVTSGDAESPIKNPIANVTQNNVAGQVYGTGVPQNVFV